ncbi:MAG: bifunctional folylpolyglutamate synthase/dihydrofolate synthase [Pseudomonadota bacterium]|nr:bifunctional folylpolyglutamate synthase/dihydrofolate synthase [Pseudomonadota bacterium]
MTATQPDSMTILERFRRGRPGEIDLTLRPAYRELLQRLGAPHQHLPPVFHVAGTNGKGSVCAFLRSILEAAGKNVHVYTSPHLERFHERIRIAGTLIREDQLRDLVLECERLAAPGAVTYFEAVTAVAFAAFARHPADFTILETGLGGRLDATNMVDRPRATIITRLSYDHREFLGTTLRAITREKAGIMKPGVPCFVAPQSDIESLETLRAAAEALKAPLSIGAHDWQAAPGEVGFVYRDAQRTLELPLPALLGTHQCWNASLAIASLLGTGFSDTNAIKTGMRSVEWPARLQELKQGQLRRLLPNSWELWLDGGHNDSAGEVLALQAASWQRSASRPLHLVAGMLNTKRPQEFFLPLAPFAKSLHCVPIPDEPQSLSAGALREEACQVGIQNVTTAIDVAAALREIAKTSPLGRVLICGSLYLAGDVLRQNNR